MDWETMTETKMEKDRQTDRQMMAFLLVWEVLVRE